MNILVFMNKVLKSWALLLLLPATSKGNSTSLEEEMDLKPARYTHLNNEQLAFKVSEESLVKKIVSDELTNWPTDSVPQQLDLQKLDKKTKIYQKCNHLLNPKLTSSPTNPRLETTIQLDENLDFKFCVLHEHWEQSIPNDVHSNFKTRRASDNYDAVFNFYRKTKPEFAQHKDCLHKTRKFVKPFPGTCYSKNYYNPRSSEFWAFWSQMGGDIMYTFDFVLYDSKNPKRKENQFWYLIAYLRIIALQIKDPHMFIKNIRKVALYEKMFQTVDGRISAASDQLKSLILLYTKKLAGKAANKAYKMVLAAMKG